MPWCCKWGRSPCLAYCLKNHGCKHAEFRCSTFFLTFRSFGLNLESLLRFFLCTLHYSLLLLVLFLQEAPAVIESYYNKRIVGCPGGEGGKSVLSSPFYFSKVNSWCGVKHLCNKLLGFGLFSPAFFLQRMNMMLYGSGWKKMSLMNVQSARNTLW